MGSIMKNRLLNNWFILKKLKWRNKNIRWHIPFSAIAYLQKAPSYYRLFGKNVLDSPYSAYGRKYYDIIK